MSKSPKPAALPLVDAETAAKIASISRRQWDRLVRLKVIPRAGPRRYDLLVAIPAAVKYLRDGSVETGDLAEEKVKLTAAQRRAIEQRTDSRAAKLVPSEEAVQAIHAFVGAAVTALKAMARRVAAEIPNESTAEQRLTIAEEEVRVAHHSMIAAAAPGVVQPLEFYPDEIPGAPHQWQGATFAEELRLYREDLLEEGPDYFSMRARHYARVALANTFARSRGTNR